MTTFYSYNQIATATAQLFNVKKGIETASYVKKQTGWDYYSWDQINETLYSKGWSPAHLLRLLSNLKMNQ